MELNAWTQSLRTLYDSAVRRYESGDRDIAGYFSDSETDFLSSIGLKPINVYDFAEDLSDSGEPDWDTFLLIASARRDYFLYELNGRGGGLEITEPELPAREAELGGIRWLPRILAKARCFLEGTLCRDIMYCCGGDRNFLRSHNLHPADFLRAVWAARGDDQKVLAFVRAAT